MSSKILLCVLIKGYNCTEASTVVFKCKRANVAQNDNVWVSPEKCIYVLCVKLHTLCFHFYFLLGIVGFPEPQLKLFFYYYYCFYIFMETSFSKTTMPNKKNKCHNCKIGGRKCCFLLLFLFCMFKRVSPWFQSFIVLKW